MLLSIVYVLALCLFGLIALRGRGEGSKDVEMLDLRRDVAVLSRQIDRPLADEKAEWCLPARGNS